MFRTFFLIATTITLVIGANVARADHDNELRYVLRGALIGAAVGGLISQGRHDHYVEHRYVVDYDRHRHGYRRNRHRGYQSRSHRSYRADFRADGRRFGDRRHERSRRHH